MVRSSTSSDSLGADTVPHENKAQHLVAGPREFAMSSTEAPRFFPHYSIP